MKNLVKGDNFVEIEDSVTWDNLIHKYAFLKKICILNDPSMFENIAIPMHMVCDSSVLEH